MKVYIFPIVFKIYICAYFAGTKITCPSTMVKCGNDICANALTECTISPVTPATGQTQCIDGTVRATQSCPQALSCINPSYIRCWNGECAPSLSNCPTYQPCKSGYKRCPGGMCQLSCGSEIMCPTSKYKCFDSSCRIRRDDCPSPPTKSDSLSFLCAANNQRASSQNNCFGYVTCSTATDTICWSNLQLCSSSSSCLSTYASICPIGYSSCSNSACITDNNYCNDLCIGINSYRCSNGQCVQRAQDCFNETSSCQSFQPIKCLDGACSDTINTCPSSIACGASTNRCPDGACLSDISTCNDISGCPLDKPLLCLNGKCIDGKTMQCPLPACNPRTPILCSNGVCVNSKANCPIIIDSQDIQFCTSISPSSIQLLKPCADGSCIIENYNCRPLNNCPIGLFYCNDGTCRGSATDCPSSTQYACPVRKSIRCPNGICVSNINACTGMSTGCPYQYSKCLTYPNMRHIGRCYQGSNSVCNDNIDRQFDSSGCQNGYSKCPLGDCQMTGVRCPTTLPCPDGRTPFICSDGTCAETPLYLPTNTMTSCKPQVSCILRSETIQCDNSECVEDPGQCPPSLCTGYICQNGDCVTDEDACTTLRASIHSCPKSQPILCMRGYCVKYVEDCIIFNEGTCAANNQFLCADKTCQSGYSKCTVLTVTCVNPKPFLCSDGSCSISMANCAALPLGCYDLSSPVKCPDGSCGSSIAACPNNPGCPAGLKLCEDGFCRIDCPNYYGCPINSPFHCPNGFCGQTLSQCAGSSNCPIDEPFMCSDYTCADSIASCPSISYFSNVKNLILTLDLEEEKKVDFCMDSDTYEICGYIVFPPHTRLCGSTSCSSILEIRPIPNNIVNQYSLQTADSLYLYYLRQIIQFGFAQLYSSTFIRFPAFSFANSVLLGNTFSFNINVDLYLYAGGTVNISNYCLASLTSNRILTCTLYPSDTDSNGFLKFKLKSAGQFALIYNPTLNYPSSPNNYPSCGWPCKYPREFIFSIFSFIYFSLILIMTIWCISIREDRRQHRSRKAARFFDKIETKYGEQEQPNDNENEINEHLRDNSEILNKVSLKKKEPEDHNIENVQNTKVIHSQKKADKNKNKNEYEDRIILANKNNSNKVEPNSNNEESMRSENADVSSARISEDVNQIGEFGQPAIKKEEAASKNQTYFAE